MRQQLFLLFLNCSGSWRAVTSTVTAHSAGIANPITAEIRAKLTENISAYERAIAVLAILAIVLWVIEKRYKVVTRFFEGCDDPLNLAIVRVAVFTALLLQESYSRVVFFSSLPHELQVPPFGWGLLLRELPINPHFTSAVYIVFAIACLAAILGLFTRCSTLATALLGVYVLGIPQFYGKVNHYHHLLWFAFVLAFSRCGDAFSLDSLFAAAKRADKGSIHPPSPSNAYRYPIRLMLLLLSLAYLFPGIWKIARGGLAWILTDNLKITMYEKWMEFGSWTPAIRPDSYPLLLRLAAAGTIAFEISFLFLVLFPRTRRLAFFSGLGFHNSIGFLMRIPFVSLQMMYVCFIDWKRLFEWLGKRMFPSMGLVVFDGNCKLCRRAVAILQSLSWYDRLQFIGSTDVESLEGAGLHHIAEMPVLENFLYVSGGRSAEGYGAYCELLKRIPLLSPLWPIFILPPIKHLGRKVYSAVAQSRTCSLKRLQVSEKQVMLATRPSGVLIAVGAVLISLNLLYGILHVGNAWPFACYPTFDKVRQPQYDTLVLRVRTLNGTEQRDAMLGDPALGAAFSPERWGGAITFAAGQTPGDATERRLNALWAVWCRFHQVPNDVESVTFERDTVLMDVTRQVRSVVSTEDIETIHTHPVPSISGTHQNLFSESSPNNVAPARE